MIRLLTTLAAALLVAFSAIAQSEDYLVQPGDRLEISVLEDPGLNRQVLIRPDGRFSMPLAGTIQAEGQTPERIQSAIRSRLARDFVEPPTVTVSLVGLAAEELDLAAVYIVGQVASPGRYDVELPIDALQMLAQAGGPGTFAARDRIQIRRRLGGGGEEVILFDYDGVEDGQVPFERIQLVDGDVIVVPEAGLFE